MKIDGNPLGIPRPEQWAAWARELSAHRSGRSDDSLGGQAHADWSAVTKAWPKRWRRGWTPPWPLRAGDMLAARSIITRSMVERAKQLADSDDGGTGAHALGEVVADAIPFFLPGRAAWGLAHTDVPDQPVGAELDVWTAIRLPGPEVAVWWSAEMTTGGLDPFPRFVHDYDPAPHGKPLADNQVAVPTDVPTCMVQVLTMHTRSSGTVDRACPLGVVLLAGPDGTPSDAVIWLVAMRMHGGERDGGWVLNPIPGLRSEAGWWQMLEAVTAVVAWGDWLPDAPIVLHNRAKLRRLRMAGIDLSALGPVRVLDSRRTDATGHDKGEPEIGTSPSTHIRRGHFRRQSVGPRDAPHHELRWISPVLVNPGGIGAADPRPTVFALPPPERTLGNRALVRKLITSG